MVIAERWSKKVSNVKVLYSGNRGIVTFDKKKPIFQHKNSKVTLDIGLGIIDEESLVDKGKFAFAEITNVTSVIPSVYLTIDYYENVGVPLKIFKGVYGNCVFIKEEYLGKTFIKALDEEGKTLVHESAKGYNGTYNMNFGRLDNAMGVWEDITEGVLANIVDSINIKNSEVNLSNPYILLALKRLQKNNIGKASNGVIFATGKYESLVIWGNDNRVSMAWLGRCIENSDVFIDIKDELNSKMIECGIV